MIMTLKQKKTIFKLRINLNHNIYKAPVIVWPPVPVPILVPVLVVFLFLFSKSGLWVLTVIYFGFNSTFINCKKRIKQNAKH